MKKATVMFQIVSVTLGLIAIALCQPPSYSAQYAKIRYQPQTTMADLKKSELNLDETSKEEVTENLSRPQRPVSHDDSEPISSAELSEITTEAESEQINFARFTHRKITKDKLKEENTSVEKEIIQEELLKSMDDETALDSLNPENQTETLSNAQYNNGGDHIESLDDSAESELTDLNEQGVYYIIHPNGIFQKVVYKTYDEPGNRQVSTQGQYGNFAPIVEPVYTYDPRTFVLQRLILRTQSQV